MARLRDRELAFGVSRFCILLILLSLALLWAGCRQPGARAASGFEYPYTNSVKSVGAAFAALPLPAKHTIRAHVGATEISGISELNVSGEKVYEVTFATSGLFPPLYVAEDGSLLNPDFTVAVGAAESPGGTETGGSSKIALADLPEPVRKQLVTSSPKAVVSSIEKELWGNREVYLITLDDAAKTRLYIESDGTVLTGPPGQSPR